MKSFLNNYYRVYSELLNDNSLYDNFIAVKELLVETNRNGNTTYIQGNGASAAIAGHCALDFTKQAKIKAMSFNEPSLITAYANDYGYENWVKEALASYSVNNDVAILISSSGRSINIINAAQYAKENGLKVITFSGFSKDNPLYQIGDINFCVEVKAYNIIECIHMIWITTIIDLIIGKAEYSVN